MCLPIVVFMIILRAPAYYTAPPEWTWVGNDASHALGIMAFSFACSQVAFNNFLTLKDQSPFSWCQSTALATGMSWTVSITFAIVGYTCFGDNVQPNLFMNFDSNDGMINIGRFLLAVTMIFTIPYVSTGHLFFATRVSSLHSCHIEWAYSLHVKRSIRHLDLKHPANNPINGSTILSLWWCSQQSWYLE